MSERLPGGVIGHAVEAGLGGGFETIERALLDLAEGKAVIVVDDENRENEGDLIFAAE